MRFPHVAFPLFSGLVAASFCLLPISEAQAQVLWYNGDDDAVNSQYDTSTSGFTGTVYDDFNVTAPAGWNVTGLFGNYLPFSSSTTLGALTSANWEIRSGVSAGNGGTLVASGTSAATVVGNLDASQNTLYTVSVSGLNLNLAAGTYWLGLQPNSSGFGYLVTTSGVNAVGTPAGNNGNSFYSDNFTPNNLTASGADYSEGVTGTAVPEPSAWALTLVASACLVFSRAKFRRA